MKPKPPGIDGWVLLPEGGAFHGKLKTAVIADLHLGYEWARGASGDSIPAHSRAETVAKLESMLRTHCFERLVVAGDVVESARPCSRTALDLGRLSGWLSDRGVSLILIQGNHDRSLGRMMTGSGAWAKDGGLVVETRLSLDGWFIEHGHCPASEGRVISGHHHPVLRVAGHSAPCFLMGPDRIILPAFSGNAAGLDVASARLPVAWRGQCLRCLVSTGSRLLDFGSLATLAARLERNCSPRS